MIIKCILCNVIFERKAQTVVPIGELKNIFIYITIKHVYDHNIFLDDVKVEPLIHGHVQIKKRQPRSPQYTDGSSGGQVAELSAANNYGIDPTENFGNLAVESSTVQANVQASTSANVSRRPQSNNVRPSSTTVNWPMVNKNQAAGGYWPITNNFNRRNPNTGQEVQGIESQGDIYFPNRQNPFLNYSNQYG